MVLREKVAEIKELLTEFPAVAILGPRQCGKSTLAKSIIKGREAIYLDLENPDDAVKLQDPGLFFENNRDKLICLDEIQLREDLFPRFRSLIDQTNRPGQLLLLGSAAPHLRKKSSETLAGRIAFVRLHPFSLPELAVEEKLDFQQLWLRGGFPKSYLASSDKMSLIWRKNFIATFLERDLALWGVGTSPETMRRFWRMCAHLHGQTLNYSQLGKSLGVSHTTARNYTDTLRDTFMIQLIEPFYANLSKRITKAPKIYITDSGIFHSLAQIHSYEDLLAHPKAGFSWEGFVVNQIIRSTDEWEISYLRTSGLAEIDLLLTKGRHKIAIECKLNTAPKPSRGFYTLLSDLKVDKGIIIAPVKSSFPVKEKVEVMTLEDAINTLK